MGLDMYLNRMPRYKEVTANQINAIENWFDYEQAKADGNEYAKCTFKEWCGCREEDLPDNEIVEYFRSIRTFNYPSWDKEKKWGSWRIIEQVGYWRKANQIHNWFVNNVQDGEDDCDYHDEVTKEMLEALKTICETVIKSSTMTTGKLYNGCEWKNGEEIPVLEDGLIIENPTIASILLPTTSGFFFGNTGYNEWYINDLKETIDIIDKVLAETDFDSQMIFYVSSW
jgi:hypothetical protein